MPKSDRQRIVEYYKGQGYRTLTKSFLVFWKPGEEHVIVIDEVDQLFRGTLIDGKLRVSDNRLVLPEKNILEGGDKQE